MNPLLEAALQLQVTAPNGVPVDIALAALPFEGQAIERATLFEFAPGCSLRTCSAEDLMILNSFPSGRRTWSMWNPSPRCGEKSSIGNTW
jgi:hypothetical protein